MVPYRELRSRLDAARLEVLQLVAAGEEMLAAGRALGPNELPPGAAALPFSPRVWDAWAGNAAKLRGVKRLDDAPYATHPTRMALASYWLLPEPEREESAILAMLHDYLEEGDGFSPASLKAMRRRFPQELAAARAAVLLSEPEIPYERLGPDSDRWSWLRVAYVVQAGLAVRQAGGRFFANAALADKLDNLHDLGFIECDRHLRPARRAAKLAVRLGYFRFVAEAVGDAAFPGLTSLLLEAVASRTRELAVPPELVDAEASGLAARRGAKGAEIEGLINEFHNEIELY